MTPEQSVRANAIVEEKLAAARSAIIAEMQTILNDYETEELKNPGLADLSDADAETVISRFAAEL